MKRVVIAAVVLTIAFGIGVFAAPSDAHYSATPAVSACSSGYVDGVIAGEHKCLRAGEFCSPGAEADYERYGFMCVDGRLRSGAASNPPTTTAAPPPTTTTATSPVTGATTTRFTTTSGITTVTTTTPGDKIDPGPPVLLKPIARRTGCRLGVLPDRRCSPGAYATNLTKDVICSKDFRTGDVRNVSDKTKHAIEQEYGLAPRGYGSSLEIDHIISLELGGSNDPANLYPEKLTFPNHQPGYRIKDKVETKAAKAVCAGTITLSYAQHQIAADWRVLYKRLYGSTATGQ